MSDFHVVALSGGKDSTAMALRLREMNPNVDYIYICTPTGDELPEMFEHWIHLGELLGKKIQPIMAGTLNGLIEKQKALPNWRQRWCTRMLKIEPYSAWLMAASKECDKIYSYVGLRADEEERVGGDYQKVPGVINVYPLREWGWKIEDVYGYLEDKKISIPARTDCARCFYQTIAEWWELWKTHPDIYQDAVNQEQKISEIRGKKTTFRSPGRDTWEASLEGLRKEFEGGRVPRGVDSQLDSVGGMKCRVCRS